MYFLPRLNFKQYIPDKRSRFGIKFFSLCEESGYLWNTYVYVGRDNRDEDSILIKQLGNSGAVIPKLISDLFGKGYHLYVEREPCWIPLGQQNTHVWDSNATKN